MAASDPEQPATKALLGNCLLKATILIFSILLPAMPAVAETPWEVYLAIPSPQNAKYVEEISYSTDNDEFLWYDLMLLETQVASGDVEALKLTLRLAKVADGDMLDAELLHALEIIASRSIRSHPDRFLEAATADTSSDQFVNAVLAVVGEEYVDRPLARRYELEARCQALRGLRQRGELPKLDSMLLTLEKAIARLD